MASILKSNLFKTVYVYSQTVVILKKLNKLDDNPILYVFTNETNLQTLCTYVGTYLKVIYFGDSETLFCSHYQDLQKLLDESINGVVYMSFGSNVRSSELSMEKRNAFINVFKKLKQTILWKWEDDELEGKPSNLEIRKWLPQKDILAHPNVKVFISHGGLIGTYEAVFNGVPIIGVPIYADQYNNLLLAQEAGFAKILQYHEINEAILEKTLLEVLYNDSFKIKAVEMSNIFKDRPMNALDTAMFWIEYVIRNKGAEYMKSPARNMSWIAYNMFDVYIFMIAIVISIMLILIYIFKVTLKLVSDRIHVTIDKKNM